MNQSHLQKFLRRWGDQDFLWWHCLPYLQICFQHHHLCQYKVSLSLFVESNIQGVLSIGTHFRFQFLTFLMELSSNASKNWKLHPMWFSPWSTRSSLDYHPLLCFAAALNVMHDAWWCLRMFVSAAWLSSFN